MSVWTFALAYLAVGVAATLAAAAFAHRMGDRLLVHFLLTRGVACALTWPLLALAVVGIAPRENAARTRALQAKLERELEEANR